MVKKTSGEDSICPLYSWTKHGWAKKHLTRNIFCQNRFGQEFWLPIYGLVKTRLVEIFGWPHTAWSKRVWSRFLVGHIRLGQNAFGLNTIYAKYVWSKYYLCQICLVRIVSLPNAIKAKFFPSNFVQCTAFFNQILSSPTTCRPTIYGPDVIILKRYLCYPRNF